jgi:hypothetical protein
MTETESQATVLAAVQICRSMKNVNVRGITYLIEVEGRFVKIGYTNSDSAATRLANLQTACPFEYRMIAEIPGGKELERCLHDLFAEFRRSGEWFEICGAVKAFIERIEAGHHLAHNISEPMAETNAVN